MKDDFLQAVRLSYSVKTSVAPSGERWALIVGPPDGIAHEPSTLYGAMCLRERGLSHNSQTAHLGAVVIALNWAERKGIDLDARIGSCDLLTRNEVVDLRLNLRWNLNHDKAKDPEAKASTRATVSHATFYNRVHFVWDYIVWHAEEVIRRIPARDSARAREARLRLDDFKKMFLSGLPVPKDGEREAMDETTEAAFLGAIMPGSPTNPFKPHVQHRNYALLLLYYETGCRRGEALKIKGEDLFLHGKTPHLMIVVRNDEKADPRTFEPRAKTLGRREEVGPILAAAIQNYVVNHRAKLPGAKRTPYVFLNHRGTPISLPSVNDMFRLLRTSVPGIADDFTPHVVRHSMNERFSEMADELGWSESEELQARNYKNGWKKTSKTGERYLRRHTKRKAAEASLRMQANSWEGKAR